jgi:hypothetical protein
LLKKGEDSILIQSSQQKNFIAESHPPPSRQYTRVVQETTKSRTKDYKEGDTVWMWDTKKGEPTNVKGSAQFWLGPFRVGRKSVDDAYYLSVKIPGPISLPSWSVFDQRKALSFTVR